MKKANWILALLIFSTVAHIFMARHWKGGSAFTLGVVQSVFVIVLVVIMHYVVRQESRKIKTEVFGDWIVWASRRRLWWFFLLFAIHMVAWKYSGYRQLVESGGAVMSMSFYSVFHGRAQVKRIWQIVG